MVEGLGQFLCRLSSVAKVLCIVFGGLFVLQGLHDADVRQVLAGAWGMALGATLFLRRFRRCPAQPASEAGRLEGTGTHPRRRS